MARSCRTWVLVADDVKANIFVADTPREPLRAVPGTDFRSPATQAPAGGAMFDGAWDDARHLAQRTASYLEQAAVDARFEQLVLVGPRTVIGELRHALGRDAARRVVALLANDRVPARLTRLPAAAI